MYDAFVSNVIQGIARITFVIQLYPIRLYSANNLTDNAFY